MSQMLPVNNFEWIKDTYNEESDELKKLFAIVN